MAETAKVRQTRFERDFTPEVVFTGELKTDIVGRIQEQVKKKGMIRKLLITRDMATDILSLNKNNRPVQNDYVYSIHEEMLGGRWQYTNESIIAISDKGNLLDGQHRLLGIWKSGVPQLFDIITGYDEETFKVLNHGRGRTPGDTLALEGFKDPNKAAAAITFVMMFQLYRKVGSGGRTKLVTDYQRVDWVRDEKNKKSAIESLAKANDLVKYGKFLHHSIWAGMYFLLSAVRKADADEFLTRLATGEGISREKDSAVWFLRKALEQFSDKEKYIARKRINEYKVVYIITAWNYYVQRNGKGGHLEIEKLRVDRNYGEIPEINRS